MRMSDWSSDVCSSDLDQNRPVFGRISEKEPLGARSCAADRRPDPDREHRDSELYRRPCPPKAVASGYRPGEGKGARMARPSIQHGPCRLPPGFPSEPAGRERPGPTGSCLHRAERKGVLAGKIRSVGEYTKSDQIQKKKNK